MTAFALAARGHAAGSLHVAVAAGLLLALAAAPATAEWQQFTASRDGLPGQQVFAIVQGRAGAIAFATDQGAGIFDGVRWAVVDGASGLPYSS